MQAGDVQAGDLQSRAGDADQSGHVLGGDFAAFVGDVKAETIAIEGDRVGEVGYGQADVVRGQRECRLFGISHTTVRWRRCVPGESCIESRRPARASTTPK